MPSDDLKAADSHFAFGQNWASFANLIGQPEIDEAKRGLLTLVPPAELVGRSFLDIGCGSGLHVLAAAQLGAARLLATDIDTVSVETTRAVLTRFAVAVPWEARTISVFDLDPERDGRFDIVYSWGVLHHTGAMWEAVAKAAAMVAPGGLLVIALYRQIVLDAFWKVEKRWYSKASPTAQKVAQGVYMSAFRVAMLASGKGSFAQYVANYRSNRGMDFAHNVHDWLGGYPYESADPVDVQSHLKPLGFSPRTVVARGRELGLFGSGCDEFVFKREKR